MRQRNEPPQASPCDSTVWIAFGAERRIALGPPGDVAAKVRAFAEGSPRDAVLVFDAATSQPVELDLHGSAAAVIASLAFAGGVTSRAAPQVEQEPVQPRRPGRPRLGVVAREVTLLPRHWDWLSTQPGGASVALRKLVEQALRTHRDSDRIREAKEAAYRFMHAMAGDAPGFEEATRALFAGDEEKLLREVAAWPEDVRSHTLTLARVALTEGTA